MIAFIQKHAGTFGMALALFFGFTASAMAGTNGNEFSDVWTTLSEWSQGTLGKIIALGMVLTGLGMGVVRQSIVGVVVGIAGGLALYNAPTVIDGIVSAVL